MCAGHQLQAVLRDRSLHRLPGRVHAAGHAVRAAAGERAGHAVSRRHDHEVCADAAGLRGSPPAVPAACPRPAPAASPFSAVQTTPQAWAAAGADVSRSAAAGSRRRRPCHRPPPPTAPTYQYASRWRSAPEGYGEPGRAPPQTITPQPPPHLRAAAGPTGSWPSPSRTQPPAAAVTPPPSLKPIPELPRNGNGAAATAAAGDPGPSRAGDPTVPAADIGPAGGHHGRGPGRNAGASGHRPGSRHRRISRGCSSRRATPPPGALPTAARLESNIRRPPCRPGGRDTLMPAALRVPALAGSRGARRDQCRHRRRLRAGGRPPRVPG